MAKIEEAIETGPDEEVVAAPAKIDVTRTELVWPGKYEESGNRRAVERVSLPFQVIERVNESRATREIRADRGLTLFDVWKGDEGQTFEEGWRNKLIWGDNVLVMNSLLESFAGKIDLIYIDPPFATGADFSFTAQIGESGAEVVKEQSAIEEKAYRDTWGRGTASFLDMLYSRLRLMRDLLAADGAIYVHCDYRASHLVRSLMDDVFGANNFLNHLIWMFSTRSSIKSTWKRSHHDILLYKKSNDPVFNWDDEVVLEPLSESTIKKYRLEDENGRYRLNGRNIKGSPIRSAKDVDPSWEQTNPELVVRDYLRAGKVATDYFFINIENQSSIARTGYPTQKPEELLHKLIAASSRPGALVADFFCGSGTTLAVAEQMGRRWIGCDLGRFAIHVSRKRLLGTESCMPFELLNLGKYERRYWQVSTFGEDLDDDGVISLFEYVAFILKLYGAAPTTGLQHLHGKLGIAFVHVGAVDAPVTIDEVAACVEEAAALKASELHVLGWEWEMGMNDLVSEEAKRRGVKVVLRQIPREVMEEQAAEKGDLQFFELAYLEASAELTGGQREITVALENFVIPSPELVPADVREKITKWSDYVDYWAVDWAFRDDTFMQGWVTYRTRTNRKLELRSEAHAYDEPGEYAVMVKVIDVFGNDTSKILRVSVS